MKYRAFLLFLLMGIGSTIVLAEQITTVAIIDVVQIFDTFPNKSYGYERLNNLKEQYQQEIDDLILELDAVKRQRLNSLNTQDYDSVMSLDVKINNMSNYIDSLSKQRQNDLIRKSKTPVSQEFLEKLQNAISYVAEEKGFTLVLQTSMDGIQWWAPVIEITDFVIERLQEIL